MKNLEDNLKIKLDVLFTKLRENPFRLGKFSEKLTKDLFELKIYYLKKWIRIIYAFDKGQIIILLHGFTKKKNKTPPKKIKLAERRLKYYKSKKE